MKITLEINSCKQCPFFKEQIMYTADSFETAFTWICKNKDKEIQGYVEWHDEAKIKIPNWCPISSVD